MNFVTKISEIKKFSDYHLIKFICNFRIPMRRAFLIGMNDTMLFDEGLLKGEYKKVKEIVLLTILPIFIYYITSFT